MKTLQIKRSYEYITPGKIHDTQIIESFLSGYIDYYGNGGALEHAQAELSNIRSGLAELLFALHGKKIVDLCIEQKE
jgi:hypothetical protein